MAATREALIAEARSFIGTPYAINARVKGLQGGIDCATLLFCCMRNVDLIPDEETGIFKGDWWAHSNQDVYIQRMYRHAAKVADAVCYRSLDAKAGNLMLCRAAGSKVFNHGAIITSWPFGVEAVEPAVHETDISASPLWAFQEIVIFDPFVRKHEREISQ